MTTNKHKIMNISKTEKMSDKKLGRGLSALLGNSRENSLHNNSSNFAENNGEKIIEIELKKIIAGIYQPRHKFDTASLDNLAESIRENGVIQPIILRQKNGEEKFEIIAGERRFRAANLVKLTKIPAIIKKIDDRQALEIALIENIQRNDLLLTEEAEGYQRLMKEFSYTQENMANKLGKSRSHIANLLRILSLPKKVLNLLDDKQLSMGHARAIIGAENVEDLADLIVEKGYSVREVEEMMRLQKESQNQGSNKNLNKNSAKVPTSQNKTQFSSFEKKFAEASGLKVKISYDPKKNLGEVKFRFSEPKNLQKAFAKLFS